MVKSTVEEVLPLWMSTQSTAMIQRRTGGAFYHLSLSDALAWVKASMVKSTGGLRNIPVNQTMTFTHNNDTINWKGGSRQ